MTPTNRILISWLLVYAGLAIAGHFAQAVYLFCLAIAAVMAPTASHVATVLS
jgi:hypothetical protein